MRPEQSKPYFTDEKGQVQYVSFIISLESTVRSFVSEPGENKTFGIYNLSLEIGQKIYGNKKLMVEPYIKIPLSRYSENDLDLKQAGARLKLRF